jgi:hypothetical protein
VLLSILRKEPLGEVQALLHLGQPLADISQLVQTPIGLLNELQLPGRCPMLAPQEYDPDPGPTGNRTGEKCPDDRCVHLSLPGELDAVP